MLLYACIVILVLVAMLLFFVVRAFWTKNRLNAELSDQKKRLEEQRDQLISLSKQLEEATHAKLVFFTNVSHDFRTPLTLISDPVEQLLADRSISGQSHQLLELMKKNVHILLRLVNPPQILDFRKVENGRMELHLEPFDLLESFKGWNDSFRMALLKKHIAFSFEPASGVDYRMLADAGKMERIYFNLLSNAVKYTQENGKIVVRLEAEDSHFPFCRYSISGQLYFLPLM